MLFGKSLYQGPKLINLEANGTQKNSELGHKIGIYLAIQERIHLFQRDMISEGREDTREDPRRPEETSNFKPFYMEALGDLKKIRAQLYK